MRSSKAAIDLIIAEEVTSKAVYIKRYQRPEWPGLQSGITIGIGYDCGYASGAQIRADWGPYLPAEMVNALARVAGKTGSNAKAVLASVRKVVSVPWDDANQVFMHHDVPKWESIVLKAIPAAENLSPDCFGAVLSLTFNRGPSFNKAGDRYKEMRAIKALITAGMYSEVPAQFKSMTRLWSNGLVARRKKEAALFQKGLTAMATKLVGADDEDNLEVSARARNETGDDRSDVTNFENPDFTPTGNTDDDPLHGDAPTVSHAPATSKADVEAVQNRLAALGYNEFGLVDGNLGGRTVGSIAAFKLDRGLGGAATIDDALKTELDKAEAEGWKRPVADARKNATAESIQNEVPVVKQNWWQKVWAYVLGIPAMITAGFHNLFGDDADPSSYVSIAKSWFASVPLEVYLLGVVGIAAAIFLSAKKSQDTTVQLYRDGKIN